MANAMDKLARDLTGMSLDQIAGVAGSQPAARHLCPLCGGAGNVADRELVAYAAQLQRAAGG